MEALTLFQERHGDSSFIVEVEVIDGLGGGKGKETSEMNPCVWT